MEGPAVLIEHIEVENSSPSGGVISIWTLNRPDKLNALNSDSHLLIKENCKLAEENPNIRCIIIKGSEPTETSQNKKQKPVSFAAGADISEFSEKKSSDVRPFFEDNAWEAVWNLSKPTIAMIDGFALGGGLELALSCDIRIASTRSTFGQPEINLGLIPGGGGSQRLCRLIGYGKAMEIILSGRMISANESFEMGIINKLVEPEKLESTSIDLAKEISSKSPYTIKVAKKAVRFALEMPFSKGIESERNAFISLFDTKDKEIGIKSYFERTNPEWIGE